MNIITQKNNFTEETNQLKAKVVRNVSLARKLLEHVDQQPTNSIRVIDCKPDKSDPTHQRSVLVFEDNEKFQEVFSNVIEERRKEKDNRDSQNNKAMTKEIEDLKKRIAELEKKEEE